MLQPVALATQEPRRLHAHRRPPAGRGDPRARRAAAGQARRPPLRDRVRRRGVGDPLHARAADARRRARGRVAGHLRPRGVLQRDEADAQRAAGQPAGPHRGAVGDLGAVQRDERPRAVARLGRLHRPRPAAGGAARRSCPEKADAWIWRCHIDVSTPNPATMARLLPYLQAYPASLFHVAGYVPGGHGRRRQHRAAGDRPAGAEEHGALARGRRVRLPPVRDRHRPPDDLPGVALRPLEGPARRDRRLPDRQGAAPGRAARARRLDGLATTPRAGTSTTPRSRTPTATPTSTSSTTSTTSARSRSTRSSRSPTCVIQKSTREGFGLTVSEALWKGRPFIGGDVGGIPLQVEDGVSGYLVSTVEECAARALDILERPGARAGARPARQGARARALPDAALPARLPADLPRGAVVSRCRRRRTAGPRLQPGAGHLPGRRVGQARHRRPRDRADRPRLPPRRGLDRLGDDRRRRRGRRGARRRRVRDRGAGRRRVPRALRRLRPRGLRPLLQHLRQPDALVHPALPLGPEQRAGHPPPRGRGVRVRLQRRQRGPRRRRCSRRSRASTSRS